MKKQAIVIPCYNRTEPLIRLLNSLDRAKYYQSIDIVFSIDFSGSNKVEELCSQYEWKHGDKKIIIHKKNIGLRANILSCGDLLLNDYDRIILLEDDLFVSPNFCVYALSAADFYEDDINIGGISLFAYAKSETGLFNFYPLKDEKDTFFIQWPSSWGQLWTKNQWTLFRNWLKLNYDFSSCNIPDYVKSWKNSWKKFYAAYLVETNRYFVFPYLSFTGEGACPGTHVSEKTNYSIYNSSMNYNGKEFSFRSFDSDVRYKYDCFFQPISRMLEISGRKYHTSFDLYGTKTIKNINTEFIITAKQCDNIIYSYANIEIPLELNIFDDISGSFFSLVHKDDFNTGVLPLWKKESLRMIFSKKDMLKYLFGAIKNKVLMK